MKREQTKRLYKLIVGACFLAFLIFGFKPVEKIWHEQLGVKISRNHMSKLNEHHNLLHDAHQKILAEKGETAAKEFLQSPNINNGLYPAWRLKEAYNKWDWALTLLSMIFLTVIVYHLVWALGNLGFRYVRDEPSAADDTTT